MIKDAIEIALQAGSFLKSRFLSPHTISEKEGKQNLVTECDLAAEEMILSFLKKKHPTHAFLAEESGGSSQSNEILWVIDPLDGTVNFARGIPDFCVSIAACKNGKPILGVIFQPMTDELFTAEKGKGAFLNKKPLQVSKVKSLDHTLIATGFPYNIHENPMNCMQIFTSFLQKGCPIRRIGSAAMDLAYLAAGRFDTYYETGIKPWDVAAGILIAEEAGGTVSSWDGSSYPILSGKEILASNSHLHATMIDAIYQGSKT